ncbi:DNA-processing protein DprA [Nocardioides sp. GCM10027113]|uniref:DNA-processing protein DprA n=1 Tax=unclassified Nocardioides TaxID=2615069 RepID=UPI00360EF45D
MSPREAERLARVALGRLGEPGAPRLAVSVAQIGAVAVHEMLCAGEDGPTPAAPAPDPTDPDGEAERRQMVRDVAARLETSDPARDLERADRQGIRFVIPGDPEWPPGLDDLTAAPAVQDRGGPPLGLWVRGPLRLHELARPVAVVGARSATTYGTDLAGDLAAGLARRGHCVVSGAAFGIDQAAHRGALAMGGESVAVLACGVDRAYPAAHRDLLDHLARHGAVVSELAPGCSPTRLRFLARNRLIAALAVGTVVVEAAVRSGALNTANWASRLHRPLMGVPGPVTSAPSEGVHQLIRSGAATLVTSAAEVAELLGAAGEGLLEPARDAERPRDRLTRRQQQVLDAVPAQRPALPDSIARTAGMALLEVGSTLQGLLGRGLVECSSDGWRLSGAAR